MKRQKRFVSVKWCVGAAAAVGFAAWLFLSPTGRPEDVLRRMVLSPRYNKLNRAVIGTRSNGRGFSHLPRFVELHSDGAPFRAYVLDLSGIADSAEKVDTFLSASTAIERGAEPAALAASAVDVTEARFNLHTWPWGWNADYMLIVYSDAEATVDVRVSYGR